MQRLLNKRLNINSFFPICDKLLTNVTSILSCRHVMLVVSIKSYKSELSLEELLIVFFKFYFIYPMLKKRHLAAK